MTLTKKTKAKKADILNELSNRLRQGELGYLSQRIDGLLDTHEDAIRVEFGEASNHDSGICPRCNKIANLGIRVGGEFICQNCLDKVISETEDFVNSVYGGNKGLVKMRLNSLGITPRYTK